MQAIYQVLLYTVPAVVVFATAYYLLKLFFDKEAEKNQVQMRLEVQKATLPMRIQAYERLVLLLERIEPAGLVIRNNIPGMNASMLQSSLLQAIRSEFDHNLSQQLFVSARAWELVRTAREETIKRLHTAATQLPADAPAADLAGAILLNDMDIESSAIKAAMDYIKAEARNNFF